MSIKEKMANGEITRVVNLGSLVNHPRFLEYVGLMNDYDAVWIDQEHNPVSQRDIELALMACRSGGIEAFARVPPTDYGTVMRPMEAGCSGVMVAQIRTLEEAQRMVQWAKYPPIGIRGLYSSNAESRYGAVPLTEHVVNANRDRWLCLQIETTESIEIVDQIAAVDGVDSLFVGPTDLSCALGVPGEVMHPKCIEALERVSAGVAAAGKSWGVLSLSPEHAAKCRELGCQLFSITSEIDLYKRGFRGVKEDYAELFDA
ncbi:MAG: aldolase [Planctomycetaceae bacterium]|nr:aldolase [Planctomycetaceae bacterium]